MWAYKKYFLLVSGFCTDDNAVFSFSLSSNLAIPVSMYSLSSFAWIMNIYRLFPYVMKGGDVK